MKMRVKKGGGVKEGSGQSTKRIWQSDTGELEFDKTV